LGSTPKARTNENLHSVSRVGCPMSMDGKLPRGNLRAQKMLIMAKPI
jgi:hypothetical protein